MPARKEDAHRALELLEDYYAKLSRPQDAQLKQAVEQVIKIFKSSLFQALLDIQEFYEVTLMNESKSSQQKAKEALQMSSKFQAQSPFSHNNNNNRSSSPSSGSNSNYAASVSHQTQGTTQPAGDDSHGLVGRMISPNEILSSSTHKYAPSNYSSSTSTPPSATHNNNLLNQTNSSGVYNVQQQGYGNSSNNNNMAATSTSPKLQHNHPQIGIPSQSGVAGSGSNRTGRLTPDSLKGTGGFASSQATPVGHAALTRETEREDDNQFDYQEVLLERGATGLGFSISGGNDNPHLDNDTSVYITKIIPGGAAQIDGRIRVGDILTQINDDAVVDVEHQVAVDALKRAGNLVQLRIKRPKPNIFSLDIAKGNRGLGISIAGGVANQHIPDDNGIFVTKIVEGGAAWLDGRLQVGDRILAVGDVSLEDCQHDYAVNALKTTGESVILVVERFEGVAQVLTKEDERTTTRSPSTTSSPAAFPVFSMHSLMQTRAHSTTSDSHSQSPLQQQRVRSPTPSRRSEKSETTEYVYKAPIAAVEEEHEQPRLVRTVILSKGVNGLGFNIVGGEDGEGIFISYIVPGGSCDLSGQLRRGDRILSVNGINLRHATHEEAAEALKGAGQHVTIIAQYRPEEYRKFEDKIQELKEKMISASTNSLRPSLKRALYVRSLFDYDPSRDSGLPSRGLAFCFGDILHVTNASDDEWWQAKRLNPNGQEEGLGIIPSKLRVERKERARLKSVKFEPNDTNKSASTSTLDRLTGRKKDKDKDKGTKQKFAFFKGSKEQSGDDTSESEKPEELIPSYDPIVFERVKLVRPVIVMGPLKDRINDDLIAEYPDRFASCVPHTTRPRREHEVNGRDYHFVESREQMEHDIQNHLFIEAGQYSDNLYGTSIAAIKEVADRGKHCILDVSGAAVKRLHANEMYPIVVYVKPKSVDSIMEMNRRISEELAQKSLERCAKLEREFGHYFTAIVTGDTPEEIYNRVKEVIYRESGDKAWLPSKERL